MASPDTSPFLRILIEQHKQSIEEKLQLLRILEQLLPGKESSGFVPTPLQESVLAALKGRALRTDALAHKAEVNRRSLFKEPGGLPELIEEGLVAHTKRLGYFRPDAPPPEISSKQIEE